MIYIVHGENAPQSRLLIANQQNKLGIETRMEFELSQTTPQQLYETAISGDLFGNLPFIVLDITSANKQAVEPYIETFKKIPDKANLIIYAQKTLPKTHPVMTELSALNARLITNNKEIESNIFKFVDNLFYKNRSVTYKELEKMIKEDADPFYTMSMIWYGLRTITNYIFQAPSVKNMKPFILGKAAKQAEGFSTESIKTLFTEMYELDKKTKLGELSPDLAVTIAIEKILNA